MTTVELKQAYASVNNRIQQIIGKREDLEKERQDYLTQQRDLLNNMQLVTDARKLLELFIKSTEVKVKEYIEPLVNEAIVFVFQQSLEFRLVFVERRNQIEVDFIVMRDDAHKEIYNLYIQDPTKYENEFADVVKESKDINYNYGGAINQVLSLVLRLILVELLQIKGTIILDEPTSAVAETYAARVGQLVKNLSVKFNRQYIFITHSTALAAFADKSYSVKLAGSVSKVTENLE